MIIKRGTSKYIGIHSKVRRDFGRANHCEMCGANDKRRYEWANKNHLYKITREDWKSLCVSCHKRYDAGVGLNQCLKGHDLTSDNTYIFPRGNKTCRICRKARAKINNSKMRWDKNIKKMVLAR